MISFYLTRAALALMQMIKCRQKEERQLFELMLPRSDVAVTMDNKIYVHTHHSTIKFDFTRKDYQ